MRIFYLLDGIGVGLWLSPKGQDRTWQLGCDAADVNHHLVVAIPVAVASLLMAERVLEPIRREAANPVMAYLVALLPRRVASRNAVDPVTTQWFTNMVWVHAVAVFGICTEEGGCRRKDEATNSILVIKVNMTSVVVDDASCPSI